MARRMEGEKGRMMEGEEGTVGERRDRGRDRIQTAVIGGVCVLRSSL